MEPRFVEIRPEAVVRASVRLEDHQETASADEEYLDISISFEEHKIGVSLSLEEAERLRDALTAMISTELPGSQ